MSEFAKKQETFVEEEVKSDQDSEETEDGEIEKNSDDDDEEENDDDDDDEEEDEDKLEEIVSTGSNGTSNTQTSEAKIPTQNDSLPISPLTTSQSSPLKNPINPIPMAQTPKTPRNLHPFYQSQSKQTPTSTHLSQNSISSPNGRSFNNKRVISEEKVLNNGYSVNKRQKIDYNEVNYVNDNEGLRKTPVISVSGISPADLSIPATSSLTKKDSSPKIESCGSISSTRKLRPSKKFDDCIILD